jgi:hypothetical protein
MFASMRNLLATLLLIEIAVMSWPAVARDAPSWIGNSSLSDTAYQYVICSHDGIDPEEAKQVAESKCLASAAKLGGVSVTIREKTVQSLTGADSSEVAEIIPFQRDVQCEWTDRYLERVGDGYRVWLRCRVRKDSIRAGVTGNSGVAFKSNPGESGPRDAYKRGLLVIATTPKADRIAIKGQRGERVIEVTSNVMRIELREGDAEVVVRRQQYKDATRLIPPWLHGQTVSVTVFLEDGL